MATKNVIYFGSPSFSADILEGILKAKLPDINIVGVVTNPDSPIGRKKIITATPVAQVAEKYDLPIFKPEKLDQDHLLHLKILKPDLFLVVAYGKIIPQSWLDLPTIAPLNIHFSLLPKYRGSLCVSEAIKNGDTETGVTLMKLTAGLDAGPIIAQEKVAIDIDDNVETLTNKLAKAATKMLTKSTIYDLPSTIYHQQDNSLITFTPSFKTRNHTNAFIAWDQIEPCLNGQTTHDKCKMLHDLIRSLNPDPGAWTNINGKETKILKTTLKNDKLVIETIQEPGKTAKSY